MLSELLPETPMPEPLGVEPSPATTFDFARRDSLGVSVRAMGDFRGRPACGRTALENRRMVPGWLRVCAGDQHDQTHVGDAQPEVVAAKRATQRIPPRCPMCSSSSKPPAVLIE